MPTRSKKLNRKIEALCKQGCSQVNQLIDNARNGRSIEELSDCNQDEIKLIIQELDKIMTVYQPDDQSDKKPSQSDK